MTDEPTPDTSAPADGDPPGDDTEQKNARMRREDGRFTSLSTELRTVSTERDQLRTHVASLQRRDAERIAATALAQPADLFDVAGAQLEDLVTDGVVDSEKVTQRVDELLKARPGLERPRPTPRLPGHLPPAVSPQPRETLETVLRRHAQGG